MERRIRNISRRAQGPGVRGQNKALDHAYLCARRGFTLAESLIASVVLAASVVGIAGSLAASHQQTEALEQRAQAVSLARQLIEEIAAKPFDDPDGTAAALGPDTGETTGGAEHYDNIDDYDGYRDVSSPSSPTPTVQVSSTTTSSSSSSDSYTRSVSVRYRTSINGTSASYGPFALVTVQVTAPNGTTASLSQLMCNYQRGQ